MEPLVTPIPNLNGNSATSLINQITDVMDTLRKAIDAYAKASGDLTHGRNFQTVENGEYQRQLGQDALRERMMMLHVMHEELQAMALEIQRYDNR